MSSGGFLVWRGGKMTDGICKLKSLTGAEDDFEIHEGAPRLDGWPADVSASMEPMFPKDIGLADALYGTGFLVVSGAVRRFLEAGDVGKAEFLPMKIINHKGRVASEDYYVLNPLELVDCIDREASAVEYDFLDESMIRCCAHLVIRQDAVPAGLSLFRLAFWPDRIVVRRGLAERMNAAGLTGLLFYEPIEYSGLF